MVRGQSKSVPRVLYVGGFFGRVTLDFSSYTDIIRTKVNQTSRCRNALLQCLKHSRYSFVLSSILFHKLRSSIHTAHITKSSSVFSLVPVCSLRGYGSFKLSLITLLPCYQYCSLSDLAIRGGASGSIQSWGTTVNTWCSGKCSCVIEMHLSFAIGWVEQLCWLWLFSSLDCWGLHDSTDGRSILG